MTVGPFAPAGVELRPTCTDWLGGRVSLPGPYGTTGPLFPPEAKHTLATGIKTPSHPVSRARQTRSGQAASGRFIFGRTCRYSISARTAYSENCIDQIPLSIA
jgi:hypothetical protein